MSRRRSWRGRHVLLALALASLAAAAHWPALSAGWFTLDDGQYVAANERVKQGLSWGNFEYAFVSFDAPTWHPVTWVSHMLDVQLWGVNPAPMHAVNIVLHAANTILLFGVLTAMTGAFWRSALAGAVFAVHPVHVESVAWIAERKDLLSAAFGLAAMWTYVEWVRCGGWRWYGLTLILFGLALMSKPMLVTLPCALLLLDWWPLRRARVNPLRLLLEKAPMFAMSAAVCIITVFAQQAGRAMEAMSLLTLGQRAGNAIVSYAMYLINTAWPAHLAVVYPHPGNWPAANVVASIGVLAATTIAAWIMRRRAPHLLMGWLWFLGMLVPAIGLIQVGPQGMADRYMYLPLIGLLIMACWSVPSHRTSHGLRMGVAAACIAAIALLTLRTVMQARLWRDPVALFTQAAESRSNNDLAHMHLAELLARRGEWEAARDHSARALAINPTAAASHDYFGGVLVDFGRLDEAIEHFQNVIAAAPDSAQAHNNLGLTHTMLGNFEQAIQQYRTAVTLEPRFASAHLNLAQAFARRGDDHSAIEHYSRALEIDPRRAIAHANLGLLLWKNDRKDEGLRHVREAARLRPNDPAFQMQLHRLQQQHIQDRAP